MTHAMLVHFQRITVKEVYDILSGRQAAAHRPNYYYELVVQQGISNVMLIRGITLKADGSYEIIAGVGDNHFTLTGDTALYYPPEA